MKKDVSKLEREISIKIQENQMKQHNPIEEKTIEVKEALVVKMDTKEVKEKTLLPKKENVMKKEKGLRV